MTLRVVIADDEPLALLRLAIALGTMDGIELLGAAENGVEAQEMIRAFKPDVVLLDIDMPELDGVGLVDALRGAGGPAVVFVTAHDQFAVDAFRQGAIDYLLKPLDEARLRKALERVEAALGEKRAPERLANLSAVVETLQRRLEGPPSTDFWVNQKSGLTQVPMAEVTWFSVEGDYTILHSQRGDFLVHESLRSVEARLEKDAFIRVHRNAIVRRSAIAAVDRAGRSGLELRLVDGARVRVSKAYKRAIIAFMAARGAP